ncbi:MAG: threonine synthase [Angelakisella sp.]
MNYISTRDSSHRVTAAEAILRGIAPDGGLYLPEQLPMLDAAMLERLSRMDYIGRAKEILSLFLTDYTPAEIAACVEAAYGSGFEDNRPAPLSRIADGSFFLELWHGPTCAFKDMALQLLPELLTVAMQKVGGGKQAAILVATSGDTGKAALEGFRDRAGTKIMVFYPEQGVSPMQKRQMYTQQGDNVNVVAIEGNFDDAQTGVKAIFADRALAEKLEQQGYLLSSANSINWGRLLPQIVYYVSAYCDLVTGEQLAMGDRVNFCVPTGNFGNILAAHYARGMGLPIQTLLCASNQNNVLTDYLQTGVYNRNRTFYPTLSPSMDILISSNLERLLFELCGRDSAVLCGWMQSLRETGEFTMDDRAKAMLQQGFWGGSCNDEETLRMIRVVEEDCSYLCDPHTAVGVMVASQYKQATGDNTPLVVVSTASPYKFAASVLQALGQTQLPDDDFATVRLLEQTTKTTAPQPILDLQTASRRFSTVCTVDEMQAAVERFLGA